MVYGRAESALALMDPELWPAITSREKNKRSGIIVTLYNGQSGRVASCFSGMVYRLWSQAGNGVNGDMPLFVRIWLIYRVLTIPCI